MLHVVIAVGREIIVEIRFLNVDIFVRNVPVTSYRCFAKSSFKVVLKIAE